MSKIKLNKQKLNEKWKEGGRVASKWCNYYLICKEDNYYLVEVANWKAYLVTLLLTPIIIFVFVVAGLHWFIEKFFNLINQPVNPSIAAFSTLFRKSKVRTDWVKNEHLQDFEDVKLKD